MPIVINAAAFTVVISLTDAASVTDNGMGSNADARINLDAAGAINEFTNTSGSAVQGYWSSPNPPPTTNYWCRWTNTSGTLTSGTVGSWIQINATREWQVTRTVAGTKTCTGTLEIATDSGGVDVVATKTGIVLTATK